MSGFGKCFAKICRGGLTDLQCNNAIKTIFKEIRSNDKSEVLDQLPSSYDEKFLADKILTSILSMKRVKLKRERINEFFMHFDTEICIDSITSELQDTGTENFELLLESIPNDGLITEPIKSLVDEAIMDFLEYPSLIVEYIKNCDANKQVLFDFLEKSEVSSSRSLTYVVKFVATNHMEDGAEYLPRFLSSRADETKFFSFKAIVHLDQVNLLFSEILDYSLTIGSRHFEDYVQVMQNVKLSESNQKLFKAKFEQVLTTQIKKIENFLSKAKEPDSKQLESLLRRDVIPELSRYKFLETVASSCADNFRPEFESHEILSGRIFGKILPSLAKTNYFYLIEKLIEFFDEDSLIILLDHHSNWWGEINTSIVSILSKEEGFVEQLLATLYSKMMKIKSTDRKKEIRSIILSLTAISEIRIAFDYVEKLLNFDSVTVEMLVKSDKQVIEDKTVKPLHELNFDKTLKCLKRNDSQNIEFDLEGKYNEITDDVTKYGLLLIMFNQGYIKVAKFWEEINKMNPSVVFRTEINWSDETVKKFRGFDWFSTWSRQTSYLFTPILTKEIGVTGEIYDSLISSIKEAGSQFEFSRFGESEIKRIYQKLVLDRGPKSSKEFGRWFVARNKHGLEILIKNTTENNYHATEQLIGLEMEWSIKQALKDFRKMDDISVDFEAFSEKLQSRISNRSVNYYSALEWMLAIPFPTSFEFIDELCVEKDPILSVSVGGNYSGHVKIDYKRSIRLVQEYLRDFSRTNLSRLNSEIKEGIEAFIQNFSKYDPDKIGHMW